MPDCGSSPGYLWEDSDMELHLKRVKRKGPRSSLREQKPHMTAKQLQEPGVDGCLKQ